MSEQFQARTLREIDTGRVLPRGFIDAVINRYFPILSFTFIVVVFGVALKVGGTDFITYFLKYKEAYQIAAAVCAWVSAPAVLWILLRINRPTAPFANLWYIVATCSMVFTLLLTLFLFPNVSDYYTQMVRLFIVAAIPLHVVQYVFLIKNRLPFKFAQGLNFVGLFLFVYGFAVLR